MAKDGGARGDSMLNRTSTEMGPRLKSRGARIEY